MFAEIYTSTQKVS